MLSLNFVIFVHTNALKSYESALTFSYNLKIVLVLKTNYKNNLSLKILDTDPDLSIIKPRKDTTCLIISTFALNLNQVIDIILFEAEF